VFCICSFWQLTKVAPSLHCRDGAFVLRHEHREVPSDTKVQISAHKRAAFAHRRELCLQFSDLVSGLKTGSNQGKVRPGVLRHAGLCVQTEMHHLMTHTDSEGPRDHQMNRVYLIHVLCPWALFDPNVQN